MCTLLYENYLADEKWKYIVTVDETWMHFSDCNRERSVYCRKREEKDLICWLSGNKENYAKGFMIVAVFSYNRKLKIRGKKKEKWQK